MSRIEFVKSPRSFSIDDGEKRGPLSLARLAFHPSGTLLYGQVADRRLALWNLAAEATQTKKGASILGSLVCPHAAGWIRGFHLTRDGEWLATGGSDRRLKLWKCADGTPADTPTHDVAAHEGWVEGVAFSPDGKHLATVGADRQIKLWQANTLKLLASESAHTIFPRDVAFSPDGKWLVSAGEDGVAVVRDAESFKIARQIDTGLTSDQQGQTPARGGVVRLGISHDSQWLGLGGDRITLIYELATGKGVASIAQAGGDVLFGRTADWFAAGEDTIRLFEYVPNAFKPQAIAPKLDAKGKPQPVGLPSFSGREIVSIKRGGFSCGAACSNDDEQVALGKSDGTLELWQRKAEEGKAT